VLDRGGVGPNGRDEGPVLLPFCPFGDPTPQRLDLTRREVASRARRWHALVRVFRRDPADQFALVRPVGNNDLRSFAIEAQVRLALGGVGAVALVTVFGNDGPDVAIEADRVVRREGARGQESERNRNKLSHARMSLTTLPYTSVRRKSRPA